MLRQFTFGSGDTIPELRLHYRTLGDSASPAVLVLHGTGGPGQQFLNPAFHDALFAPGKLLDAHRHYVILPDGIGHGASSKPSDGLRARFPRYGYQDMVHAQHALVAPRRG